MVGIRGIVVILLVTVITICGQTGISPVGVALIAVNGVPGSEWKEVMVDVRAIPVESIHLMTFCAVLRVIPFDMVWAGSGFIISLVAIITFYPQGFEV